MANEELYVYQGEADGTNSITGISIGWATSVDEICAVAWGICDGDDGQRYTSVVDGGFITYDEESKTFTCECPFTGVEYWEIFIWKKNTGLSERDLLDEWNGETIPVDGIVDDVETVKKRLREHWVNLSRSLRAPEEGSDDLIIPPVEVRSGQILGFNSKGHPTVGDDCEAIAGFTKAASDAKSFASEAESAAAIAKESATSAKESETSAKASQEASAINAKTAESAAASAAESAEEAKKAASESGSSGGSGGGSGDLSGYAKLSGGNTFTGDQMISEGGRLSIMNGSGGGYFSALGTSGGLSIRPYGASSGDGKIYIFANGELTLGANPGNVTISTASGYKATYNDNELATVADIAKLDTKIDEIADDVVDLTSEQTITGKKTFAGSVALKDGATSTEDIQVQISDGNSLLFTKTVGGSQIQVELPITTSGTIALTSQIGDGSGTGTGATDYVDLSSDQIIGGVKTFSGSLIVSYEDKTYNVNEFVGKLYGLELSDIVRLSADNVFTGSNEFTGGLSVSSEFSAYRNYKYWLEEYDSGTAVTTISTAGYKGSGVNSIVASCYAADTKAQNVIAAIKDWHYQTSGTDVGNRLFAGVTEYFNGKSMQTPSDSEDTSHSLTSHNIIEARNTTYVNGDTYNLIAAEGGSDPDAETVSRFFTAYNTISATANKATNTIATNGTVYAHTVISTDATANVSSGGREGFVADTLISTTAALTNASTNIVTEGKSSTLTISTGNQERAGGATTTIETNGNSATTTISTSAIESSSISSQTVSTKISTIGYKDHSNTEISASSQNNATTTLSADGNYSTVEMSTPAASIKAYTPSSASDSTNELSSASFTITGTSSKTSSTISSAKDIELVAGSSSTSVLALLQEIAELKDRVTSLENYVYAN